MDHGIAPIVIIEPEIDQPTNKLYLGFFGSAEYLGLALGFMFAASLYAMYPKPK